MLGSSRPLGYKVGMAVTVGAFRKLALGLPGMEEKDHWGNPSFRVRGKIVATLQLERNTCMLMLDELETQGLLDSAHPAFEEFHWGKQQKLWIHLPKVPATLLERLMVGVWERLASKKLVAQRRLTRGQRAR